jgi:hypothetical protein
MPTIKAAVKFVLDVTGAVLFGIFVYPVMLVAILFLALAEALGLGKLLARKSQRKSR